MAAVFSEIGQQIVHYRKRCAVQHIAALTLLADKLGMRQLFEVERKGVGRNAQLLGQGTRRQTFGAAHYQSAEHPQTGFVGQSGERTNYLNFLHWSIIQQLLKY